jgi:hypothetical protein
MRYTIALALLLVCLATTSPLGADQAVPVGGVYEMGIGVTDPIPVILYWQQFGYTLRREGTLDRTAAEQLYGVSSALRSIRLAHQDADHGLIRIMIWDEPVNEGLGMSPMKVLGGRWGAMLTRDIYNLLNHAEDAKVAGMPVYIVEPQKAFIYSPATKPRPFLDKATYVREMCLIQPLSRQIFFQRFHYDLPLYGSVHEDSFFRTSQISHFGLVVQGGTGQLEFYDKVLGLLKARDGLVTYDDISGRNVFELQPGEQYFVTDFDDVRSSSTDPMKMRSGRLKVIRFPDDVPLDDKRDHSRPGSLGASLYTLRVSDLDEYRRRVGEGGAGEVTAIVENEFGERSFSFVAPDGFFWTFIEASS